MKAAALALGVLAAWPQLPQPLWPWGQPTTSMILTDALTVGEPPVTTTPMLFVVPGELGVTIVVPLN